MLHSGLRNARHLEGIGDELTVVAAFAKELVGVGLLKVSVADLRRGDVRRDGQHGHHASVGVEQSIDKVQIARSATSRTNRQLASELRFGSGHKSRCFFVADADPLYLAAAMKGVGYRVQAVTDEPVDSLDACLGKCLDQLFCHSSGHDGCSRC